MEGGGDFGEFFSDSTLRKFSKERTCPHTIVCAGLLEHAARRICCLLRNKSNRICRSYAGYPVFSGREAWPCTAKVLPRPTSSSTCHKKKPIQASPMPRPTRWPTSVTLKPCAGSKGVELSTERGLAKRPGTDMAFFNIY